ncbi:DNA glycosylase [Cantharellus anzutake]|uniref:DNA glycosylase n=1 Tax=Cantharellus anzutake TaxID=1750568 RepID=UPI001904EFED|nr:DNA glycosylase [Cantharellus anzutake]KAF8342154.1 DNA glycosylase [Cantharellus anzutake]
MLKRVLSRQLIESDSEDVGEVTSTLAAPPTSDPPLIAPHNGNEPTPKKRKKASTSENNMNSRVNAQDILMGRLKPTIAASRAVPSHHSSKLHSVDRIAACPHDLLTWYSRVKALRCMPWRRDYDPSLGIGARTQHAYEVLVSEVMLQQTQMCVTVIPYYNKWMEAFPTVSALASADIEQVNQRWKGLGYYSRGSRLLDAARVIVNDMGGRFPEDAASMEKGLPGVGRYTAGAVCSIVFDQHTPAVDGNVQRLLSRLLALHAPLKGPNAKAPLELVWNVAGELVERTRDGEAGAFNQALIELGSTVCKPTNPNCGECPIKQECAAYLLSKGKMPGSAEAVDVEDLCSLCEPFPDSSTAVTRYPMKVDKKKAREEHSAVSVIEYCGPSDRWVLLVRRPEKGLLAGLYEFPTVLLDNSNLSKEQKNAAFEELLVRLIASPPIIGNAPSTELRLKKNRDAGTLLHIFSHIRMTYHIRHFQCSRVNAEEDTLPELLEPSDAVQNGANGADESDDEERVRPKKKRKTANDKGTRRTTNIESNEPRSRVKWVRIADVESENISTGALKIWKQVTKSDCSVSPYVVHYGKFEPAGIRMMSSQV